MRGPIDEGTGDPGGAGPNRWTPGTRAAAAFVVAFATWQIALPAALLLGPRPAQFGWQMFSAVLIRPALVAEHDDGTIREVDPALYVGASRFDLPYDRPLAEHLRRIDPTIVAVHRRPRDAPPRGGEGAR